MSDFFGANVTAVRFGDAAARVRKLAALIRDPLFRRGLRHGVAASVEHQALHFPTEYALILDVGANRGQFALFARRRFPGAAVLCFEPLEGAREKLTRAVGPRSGVRIEALALGASAGVQTLHVSRRDDSSSLRVIGRGQREHFAGTEEVGQVEVRTARLDEVVPANAVQRPCLLKIDVQGTELEVLQGAVATLPAVDDVLVECSFVELYEGQGLVDEVVAFLADHGFRLFGVSTPARGADGRVVQADFQFTRSAA